ncbi:MAG: DUF1109 domain-containing protein [Paracoccaceae bacterium]|nr:DUF1109 domain-containing protein [Paracoccaceae bacterium]
MDTDDLIARLATEAPPPPLHVAALSGRIVIATLLPAALFLGVLGTRADLAQAWANPVVPLKTLLPLVVCGLALGALARLVRPEAQARGLLRALAVPVLVAAGLWGWAFVTRPPVVRFAEVGMFSLSECVGLIILLAILPAAVALRVLRRGASVRPMLSGALAGLAASAGAATGYSLFCTQDNPLFFVTWYGAAIGVVTITAALVGRHLLRW